MPLLILQQGRGRAAICWDAFAYLAVIVAALIWWNPPPGPRGDTIFVSPQGSNWRSGASPQSALRTIQRAADLARPGDHVIVLPGTYYERIHVRQSGTPGLPISFEALEPGTVHISGALEEPNSAGWRWTAEGDGIYSTATRWPIYALSCEEEALYRLPWGGVDALRAMGRRERAWGAFWYEQRRLYVSLRGGKHPAECRLETHAPVPEPREWGEFKSANIWVEADHVTFSGLQFEMGIGAGILVWNGEDIAVRECAFHGATFGIKCGTGAKPSRNVRVERCLYENFPQYLWHREWLSWEECYSSYASSSLITAIDDGTSLVNNLVVHAGDGVRVTTDDVAIREGLQVTGNWIAFCTDDAVELDGHAKHVDVSDNVILECHEAFSASPVVSGPVTIGNNLVLNPSTGINGAQIKLMQLDSGSRRAAVKPISNLEVHNNFAFGNWLCWTDGGPIEHVVVRDNVFCVSHHNDPPWPSGVDARDNVVVLVENPADSLPQMLAALRAATAARPSLVVNLDRHRRQLESRPGPTWLDWQNCRATAALERLLRNPEE